MQELLSAPPPIDASLECAKILVEELDLRVCYAQQKLSEIRGREMPLQMADYILGTYYGEDAGVLWHSQPFRDRVRDAMPPDVIDGYRNPFRRLVEFGRQRVIKIFPDGTIVKKGSPPYATYHVEPDSQHHLLIEDPRPAIVRAIQLRVREQNPTVYVSSFDWDLIELPASFEILGQTILVPPKEELHALCREMEQGPWVVSQEAPPEEEPPELEPITPRYSMDEYEEVFDEYFPRNGFTQTNTMALQKMELEEETPAYGFQDNAFTIMMEWAKRQGWIIEAERLLRLSAPLAMQEVLKNRSQPCPEQALEIIEQVENESIPRLEMLLEKATEYARTAEIEKSARTRHCKRKKPKLASFAETPYTSDQYQEAMARLFPRGYSGKKTQQNKTKIKFTGRSADAVLQRAAEAVTLATTMLAIIRRMAERASEHPNAFICLLAHHGTPELFEETLKMIKTKVLPMLKEQVEATLAVPPLPEFPDKPSYFDYLNQHRYRFVPFQFAVLQVLAQVSDSEHPHRLRMKEVCDRLPADADHSQVKGILGSMKEVLKDIGLELDTGIRKVRDGSDRYHERITYRLKYTEEGAKEEVEAPPLLPHQELTANPRKLNVTERYLRLRFALKLMISAGGRGDINGAPNVVLGKFCESELGTPLSMDDLRREMLSFPKYQKRPRMIAAALSHNRKGIQKLLPVKFHRHRQGNDIRWSMTAEDLEAPSPEEIKEWVIEILREVATENGYGQTPWLAPFTLPSSLTLFGQKILLPDKETINNELKPPAGGPVKDSIDREVHKAGIKNVGCRPVVSWDLANKSIRGVGVKSAVTHKSNTTSTQPPEFSSDLISKISIERAKLILRPNLARGRHQLSVVGQTTNLYKDLQEEPFILLRGLQDHIDYDALAEKYDLANNPDAFLVINQHSCLRIEDLAHIEPYFDKKLLRPEFAGKWYKLSPQGRQRRTFYTPLFGKKIRVLTSPEDHPGYEARAVKMSLDKYPQRLLVVTEDDPDKIHLVVSDRDIQVIQIPKEPVVDDLAELQAAVQRFALTPDLERAFYRSGRSSTNLTSLNGAARKDEE